jgi:hypothetical protein
MVRQASKMPTSIRGRCLTIVTVPVARPPYDNTATTRGSHSDSRVLWTPYQW